METYMMSNGAELQVPLFFGFLILFIAVERIVPMRKPEFSQSTRWWTNAGLSTLAILLIPLMPVSFITVAAWAKNNDLGLLNYFDQFLPVSAIIFLTLFLRGFVSFFTHFLNHKIPFLWRIHRVHHFDTELDISSTVRFHPLEMPVGMIIGLPMIVLFGLSPWVLLLYELFDVTITLFSHSNIRLPSSLNKILRYVIVTPDLHKVHHSAFMQETNSNYSAVFPVWDILCGTFKTKTRAPLTTMKLGLDEVREPQASNFWWLLRSPFLQELPESKSAEAVT